MGDESKLSILLVSDDAHLREEAKFGFGDETDVILAEDSHDAWKVLAERIPDVVVVDLQTGSAGGYNLIREMHEMDRDTRTLLLLDRPQDEWLGKQAGADSIRVKPLDPAELVYEVRALATGQTTQ